MSNPILRAVRNDIDNRAPHWTRADIIERWAGELGLSATDGEYPTYSGIWRLMQDTPEAREHARVVLTRLVNVTRLA